MLRVGGRPIRASCPIPFRSQVRQDAALKGNQSEMGMGEEHCYQTVALVFTEGKGRDHLSIQQHCLTAYEKTH